MNVELQPSSASLPSLAVLEALSEGIEHATDPRDLLNLRDRAEVIRKLAARRSAVEVQYRASKAKLDCERRLGDLLRERLRNRASVRSRVGGRLEGSEKVLPDGISWDQSSTWQKLAALPERRIGNRRTPHREAFRHPIQPNQKGRHHQQNDVCAEGAEWRCRILRPRPSKPVLPADSREPEESRQVPSCPAIHPCC